MKIRNWALSLLAMTVAWLGGALATTANAGPALGLAKPMADNAIVHKAHRRKYRRTPAPLSATLASAALSPAVLLLRWAALL